MLLKREFYFDGWRRMSNCDAFLSPKCSVTLPLLLARSRMRFQLPKPLHGWREFAGEIGIIVMGVIIALALGQSAQAWQWRQEVGDARDSIHREMAFDLALAGDRLRVAKCIDRHIADAEQRIEVVAQNGETPPANANLEDPGRMLLSGDYDAQVAAQNLVHFPSAELSALGVFYDQVRDMREWNMAEDAAWGDLALLSTGDKKLGPFDVALLRRDLQAVKNYEALTVLNSRRQIERGRELGVAPGPSRPDYLYRVCKQAPV
jgi:hypothetical protein